MFLDGSTPCDLIGWGRNVEGGGAATLVKRRKGEVPK